ncbi:MAG: ACT domain-containing protein [Verrucomicrobia bacterium]|jgi:chorismate mutase / prephenate dehydratase|nr:ACT domain-containing protein [Verrucomicrobiota bacterium]
MAKQTVAFLGPLGTYSHLVTRKRFGNDAEFIPLLGIADVCSYVSRTPGAKGVVPIENSSGGTIHETIDILLNNRPRVCIEEELSLHVKLALLGHKGCPIKRLHSHFVPLEHCSPWIRKHLGRVEKKEESSTAIAAAHVTVDPYAAALGGRHLAKQFGLDILEFPVESDTPNITTFVVVSRKQVEHTRRDKITLAISLPNEPGSLYRLLGTFQQEKVNLSRLVSRPIRGAHKEYAFLIDLDGDMETPSVKRAIRDARKQSTALRICGAYPCRKPYRS